LSTSVYFCKRTFRYRLSPGTFGYTIVYGMVGFVVLNLFGL